MDIEGRISGQASDQANLGRPRNRRRPWLWVVLVLNAACASPAHMGPQAVIEGFYQAANEGRYDDAARYFAPRPVLIEGKILDPLSGTSKDLLLLAPGGDLDVVLGHYTRKGTLTYVEVNVVTLMGDTASCRVRKQFKDGTTQAGAVELFRSRRDGQWKIVWENSNL